MHKILGFCWKVSIATKLIESISKVELCEHYNRISAILCVWFILLEVCTHWAYFLALCLLEYNTTCVQKWLFGHANVSVSRSITLVKTEIPQWPSDGLPWNFVQTFIVPRGRVIDCSSTFHPVKYLSMDDDLAQNYEQTFMVPSWCKPMTCDPLIFHLLSNVRSNFSNLSKTLGYKQIPMPTC